MLFAQLWQATNAAARAELCCNSLASPELSFQATSAHISSLHEHVDARKFSKIGPLEQADWLRRPCTWNLQSNLTFPIQKTLKPKRKRKIQAFATGTLTELYATFEISAVVTHVHCGILVAVLVALHTANAHWHWNTPACPDGKCRSYNYGSCTLLL